MEKVRPGHQAVGRRETKGKIFLLQEAVALGDMGGVRLDQHLVAIVCIV